MGLGASTGHTELFPKTGEWAVIRLCPLQSQPLLGRGAKGGGDQES